MRILRRLLRPLLPWLRLGMFVACVGGVVLAVGLRHVRAEIVEAGMAFGDVLEGLGDVLPRPYVVLVNGERMFVAAATLEEAPSAVLDRLEGLCRAHDGGLLDAIADRARSEGFPAPTPGEAAPLPGLLRHENAQGGVAGCLAQDSALGLDAITERLGRVARDGDVGRLGNLRYASVRRTKSGRTHVVVVWTNGPFFPGRAFPPAIDAPGSDLERVGKPQGSRRVLAATIEGAPYGVRVYHAPSGEPPSTMDAFDAQLVRAGFARDALSREVGARSYRRGAEEVVVSVEGARVGTGSVLSVVSSAQAGGLAP